MMNCSVCLSPTEGAPSLSQSFGTVRSGPSKILQAGCNSHPAPVQYCTEDETPDVCTFIKKIFLKSLALDLDLDVRVFDGFVLPDVAENDDGDQYEAAHSY